MGARATMAQRALVERNGASGKDRFNNPAAPAWSSHIAALPCRAWFDSEREVVDGGKTAVVETRTVIVPLGTDITVRDRIASIKNRAGAVLFSGPAGIESVGRRADHLVLVLEEVS